MQIINVGMWLCAFYDFKLLGRTYLEMGAEVVAVSWPDTCPLHVAASKPSLGVLELFLTRQSELNVIDREGMTPLKVAVFHGHVAAVEMLLAAGSDVNDTFIASRATALHIAVHSGHEKIVALLLEQGAEIEAKNVLSESPLCIALRKGKYAIAKMLVDKRASCPPFSAMEQSIAEATYAFRVLSFAEGDTSPARELPQYVVQESARLEIHF
jgi:ankyrin repeat protein